MPLALTSTGIKPSELGGDEDLARRILIRARAVVPALRYVVEGSEEKADALAILRGVLARAAAIGTGAVSSQGRNGTSISFRDVKSAFTDEDISGLRSLFDGITDLVPGHGRGSFPTERPLSKIWPEGEYS